MKAAAAVSTAALLLCACMTTGTHNPPRAVALQPSCLVFCFVRVDVRDDSTTTGKSDDGRPGQGGAAP